jgi:hypothetical protein
MEITIQNIAENYHVGQEYHMINGVNMPDKLRAISVPEYDNYCWVFLNLSTDKLVKVGKKAFSITSALSGARIFTTRVEANFQVRKNLINTIDHYNKHQIKQFEIVVPPFSCELEPGQTAECPATENFNLESEK